MNKILFSEGGQPVYLDDLQLLQQNMTDIFNLASAALGAGKVSGYVLGTRSITDDVHWACSAHKIVVDGTVYDVPETKFDAPKADKALYYVLSSTAVDRRVFENGQTAACQTAHTAVVTDDVNNVASYIGLEKGVPMVDMVKSALGLNGWADEASQKKNEGFRWGAGVENGIFRSLKCNGYTKYFIQCTPNVDKGFSGLVFLEGPLRRISTSLKGVCGDDTLDKRGYLCFGQDGDCTLSTDGSWTIRDSASSGGIEIDFMFDVSDY